MNTHLPYRYPGAQPFTAEQEHLFFGRERAIRELYRLVQFERLVLLYSRSGMGKSSLLNAGILPIAKRESKFEPITIRFGAYNKDQSEMPQELTRQALRTESSSETLLSRIFPDDLSLWYAAKVRFLNCHSKKQLLLIFDQFEELFTYPQEAQEKFAKQLGELLYTELPQPVRRMEELFLQAQPDLLSDAERNLLHQNMKVHILVAIRSDRMSLLDKLTPFVPQILNKRYELNPLGEREAREAILCPTQDTSKSYASPNFEYEPAAIDLILQHLKSDVKQEIESFQLQIICHSLEEKVIDQHLKVIKASEIGEVSHIFETHYETQVARIGTPKEQLIARKLIEEDLIFAEEKRRLSLYEGQILRKPGITPELLRKLENTHLIRREPNMQVQGGYNYELSHDTLVAPVLKAREERLAQERLDLDVQLRRKQEAKVQALETQAATERRKRLRANLLSIVAVAGLAIALWQYFDAREAKIDAEYARKEAVKTLHELTEKNILELKQNAYTFQRSGDDLLAIKALEQALVYDSTKTDIKALLAKLKNKNR